MRASTVVKLCAATAVASAVMVPPVARRVREQSRQSLKRGAETYVDIRDGVTAAARSTGVAGQAITMAAGLAKQGANSAADMWKGLVAEVEHERQVEHLRANDAQRGSVMDFEDHIAARN